MPSSAPLKAVDTKVKLRLELLEDRLAPTVYAVGPGLAYPTINSVPWAKLQPGDDVQIHWKSTPYYEKVMFSASGTAQAPIVVQGVPGPEGQRPILDGTNAATASTAIYPYAGTQDRGLFIVTINDNQPWGYIPSHIEIEHLQFQNAYPGISYTDYQGNTRTYATDAAGIFIERGQYITILGCAIESNANGLFVASADDTAQLSEAITVKDNTFVNNGVVGSDHEHQSYTEALGITYVGNTFGALRPGALGDAIKDRSAGCVIENNTITAGAHALDLVDAEDAPTLIAGNPSYQTTEVIDNTISLSLAQSGNTVVFFGGDSGVTSIYRPELLFNHNRVTLTGNQSQTWWAGIFDLATPAQTVDPSGNTIEVQPATTGATPTQIYLLVADGNASFGVNRVSAGWLASDPGVAYQGVITGLSNIISLTPDATPVKPRRNEDLDALLTALSTQDLV